MIFAQTAAAQLGGGGAAAGLQAPMDVASTKDVIRNPSMVVGGRKPVDASSAGAKEAALQATLQYNAQTNSAHRFDLLRIVDGTQQVVSGVKYVLDLELGERDCAKTTPISQDCAPVVDKATGQPKAPVTIRATVWSRAWMAPEKRHQVVLEALVAPAVAETEDSEEEQENAQTHPEDEGEIVPRSGEEDEQEEEQEEGEQEDSGPLNADGDDQEEQQEQGQEDGDEDEEEGEEEEETQASAGGEEDEGEEDEQEDEADGNEEEHADPDA